MGTKLVPCRHGEHVLGIEGQKSVWTAEAFGSELIEVTIGDLLDRQAVAFGSRDAIVFNYPEIGVDVRWTYAALQAEANQLARGLIGLGIEAGDRVAVLAPNLPEWILLELALAKAGAVLVTVNTAYRQTELEYLLRQGRVRALFMVTEFRGNRFLDSVRALVPEAAHSADPLHTVLQAAKLPDLRRIVLVGDEPEAGFASFADVMRLGDQVPDEVRRQRQAVVRPRDVVQIQYTSGTTGAPKGVMLTHHGTVNNANLMGDRAGFTAEDRLISPMPLFHTAGCVCNMLGMLTKGGTFIALIAFDAQKTLQLIEAERATVINAVPTMLIRMLADPGFQAGRYDASSLRVAFTGGTSIPPSVMRQMKEEFGADPMVIMGMTEASPLITQTVPADDFELKITTAGIPLPFTEVKVIDPTTGAAVGCGVEGELCIRGYGVMKGYFDMPERTAEAIDPEGWLHSGDLATLDEHGYLRIVGRTKDMIIRGGENIYPAEVEDLLMRHPAVEQAQVVGVPDPEMGEEAFAFLVLHEGVELTEAAFRDHCRASFSRHKVPRYMAFVPSFPQTESGKVKKFELREMARQRLETHVAGRVV